MKTLARISAKKRGSRIFILCITLFVSMTLNSVNALADEGPSLGNIKKNAQAIKTEQEILDKQRAFDEKMNFVYMFLGLAAVLGIAWFSTVYAKKNKRAPVETNQHRHYIRHPHDPRRRPKVSSSRR